VRLAAITLAALTAIAQLVLFAVSEAQLDVTLLEGVGDPLGPWWSRALWSVGWALPWAVGAAILAWGRPRVGTAIVVAVAVLSLVEVVWVARLVTSVAEDAALDPLTVGAIGTAVAWAMGTAAGVTAWLARPRGAWRDGAPGPGGLFTAAAIAAWLPTAFESIAFAPPGAPRRFVEPLATDLDVASAPFIAHPLVVALVLLVAPRLRLVVAGAVTLTFALPQLASHAATLRTAVLQDLTIPTPAGVLGLAGLVVLVPVGVVWVVRGRREPVSGAATDRGPSQEV
jgi:hypothetical protein